MAVTAPFPYTIDKDLEKRNPTAVFKLRFGLSGEKYFIYKALKISGLVEGLSGQIHRELLNPKENSILYKAVAYIKKARVTTMTVELVLESDSVIDILLCEYDELQKAKDDENCLNTKFVNNDYFPQWIPQKVVNEFLKRLQGEKIPERHKNLRKYLNTQLSFMKKGKPELVEKIFTYTTTHFK